MTREVPTQPLEAFSAALTRSLSARQATLEPLLRNHGAARLFSGPRDGTPGVFIDAYATHAVLMLYEGVAPRTFADSNDAAQIALEALRPLGIRGIYTKPFARDRSRLGGELPDVATNPTPAAGDPAPELTLIREGNATLEVRMYDGLSTGLFLDQRPNRAWLAAQVAARNEQVQVLNTFAYTCAFSVAAAVAGAMTTSVDVSGKYLDWGKRNFAHNNIENVATEGGHRFAKMDTFEFLAYAARKNLTYDLAILDPPSFGTGNKRKGIRPWSATSDYARLVHETAKVMRRGGILLASTNTQELCESGRLDREITRALGRPPKWIPLPPPAPDFAGERGRFAARAFTVST